MTHFKSTSTKIAFYDDLLCRL